MPDKNYKRDYLIITYVCLPSKKNLIDKMSQTDIYKYKNNYLLSLSKPTHLMQTIKLLFSFYKEKFNTASINSKSSARDTFFSCHI